MYIPAEGQPSSSGILVGSRVGTPGLAQSMACESEIAVATSSDGGGVQIAWALQAEAAASMTVISSETDEMDWRLRAARGIRRRTTSTRLSEVAPFAFEPPLLPPPSVAKCYRYVDIYMICFCTCARGPAARVRGECRRRRSGWAREEVPE